MKHDLLSYFDIRDQLSNQLSQATEVVLLSAYVKESAVQWILDVISDEAEVTLVSRFTCSDIQAGSTDIEVIRLALDSNWSVKCVPNLHAKVYLFDRESLLVGSANLTSNGLQLFGNGNLEATVEVKPSESDIQFVDNVVTTAQSIDYLILEKMERHLEINSHGVGQKTIEEWPMDLFPISGQVWVSDFIWLTKKSDFLLQIKKDDYMRSKAYQWLKIKLKSGDNQSMSYGALSKALHTDLCDDPAPYRSSVKELLSGVIEYAELHAKSEVTVSRPRHSQVLQLR